MAAAAPPPDQALAARFAASVQRAREGTPSSVRDEQRLELYGLYKQATEGDNNGTKPPGLLDFVGRAKWNAWKALAGMDAATAMQQYVDRVTEWFPAASAAVASGEIAAAAASERGGAEGDLRFGGATVSTMGAIGLDGRVVEEDAEGGGKEEEQEPQDVFYLAKRGLVDEVRQLLEGGGASIDAQDEEGRSLLHWAVDGGHAALVECLLGRGADVGARDSQGDTPLDYAELCEYAELAALLRRARQARGEQQEREQRP